MTSSSKLALVRALLLPAALLFLLPAFGLWFSHHARDRYDSEVFGAVERAVMADASLSEEERTEALSFYRAVPASRACADNSEELANYREQLGDTCSDLRQFAYSGLAAKVAFGLGLAALLFIVACTLAAFVSRPIQYASFVVGWNVLKVVGAIETVLQGGLVVWLSFWMTAIWFESYFVKLILVAAVLAAMAAFVVLKAIFQKPWREFHVEGEILAEAVAPVLWTRIRALCEELGTSPPDHIIAGIDDNFFVTESEVEVAGRTLEGRVLYVSLSLLRTLERSEADAVFAHEMAHLLGGDTGHSKRLAPLTARYVQYLEALHSGVITIPIYYFMRAYFAAFQLAVSRSHREAELAADAAAARVTSAQDIARSLIKIGAYSSYRRRVEESLFNQDRTHDELGIASRVASGFALYASSQEDLHGDLATSVTPHPFDSHPPLTDRLAHVGVEIDREAYSAVLLVPSTSSWVDTIHDAAGIEARLWGAYEQRFAAAHDEALAYRYEPANDEEKAHVEKYFPPLSFEPQSDGPQVHVCFESIGASDWDGPVAFADIASASVEERMLKKYLDVKLKKKGGVFAAKRSVCLNKLSDSEGFLSAFNRYWGRHQVMVGHREASAGTQRP